MYRLLVSDLDGTLLDDDQRVPPANLRALEGLAAQGVRFTLATGRIEEAVRPFLEVLPLTAPLILYNGGRIVDHQTLGCLEEAQVAPDVVACSLAAVEGLPLSPHLYQNGRCYVGEATPVSRRYAAKDRVTLWPVGDLTRLAAAPASKLLFIAETEALAEAAFPTYLARLGPGIEQWAHVVRSEPTYLEVLPPGATKGAALRRLLARLGLLPEEVIAVGDGLNDLEMLEAAGLGVAVANAHPRLLACADYVTVAGAEGAIADIVTRFLVKAG